MDAFTCCCTDEEHLTTPNYREPHATVKTRERNFFSFFCRWLDPHRDLIPSSRLERVSKKKKRARPGSDSPIVVSETFECSDVSTVKGLRLSVERCLGEREKQVTVIGRRRRSRENDTIQKWLQLHINHHPHPVRRGPENRFRLVDMSTSSTARHLSPYRSLLLLPCIRDAVLFYVSISISTPMSTYAVTHHPSI